MTSRRSREQSKTEHFHKHLEIPQSQESSTVFLDLSIELQVVLDCSKGIFYLTLGHGLCLQVKVETLCYDPGKGGLCISQVVRWTLRILKLQPPP